MFTTELFFKLAFVLMFLAFATVMFYYQRGAKHGKEGLIKRTREHNQNEVPILLVGRTVFGLLWYVGTMLWLFVPGWVGWAALPLPEWLRWCGAGLGLLAVALNVWSHQTLHQKLGQNFDPLLRLQDVPRLVVDGPYRFVRHPIYLAFLLMIAAALLTSNALIGVSGVAMILSVMVVRTPEEEKRLIEQFGHLYRDYMHRTGAYLPCLEIKR